MSNYTRPGLKISVNRCYGVMNTNETVLVQIVAIKYVGGHERGTIYRGVIVLAAFQPAVIWDLKIFTQH